MTQRPPLTVSTSLGQGQHEGQSRRKCQTLCFQPSFGVATCVRQTARPFSRYLQKGTENNIHYLSLQPQNSWHHLSSSVSGKERVGIGQKLQHRSFEIFGHGSCIFLLPQVCMSFPAVVGLSPGCCERKEKNDR